jgi:tetratricopeptide (TPR) repeat protein
LSYQLLSNLLVLVAITGIILLILRRLPEAIDLPDTRKETLAAGPELLANKGLPLIAASRVKISLQLLLKRFWQFILEAKDLKHSPVINYRIRRIFKKKRVYTVQPAVPESLNLEDLSESGYLERIKRDPKNLAHYNSLGHYYLNVNSFAEAYSVFEYLTQHEPTNSDYYAKLAFIELSLQDFSGAVRSYSLSLELDSGHPNRYYNLGLALRAVGKFDESADAFKKAYELEPENKKYKETFEQLESN